MNEIIASHARSLTFSAERLLGRLFCSQFNHKTRTRLEFKVYKELDNIEGLDGISDSLKSAVRAAKWIVGQSNEHECTHAERASCAFEAMKVLENWRHEEDLSPVGFPAREGVHPVQQNVSEIPF